MSIFEALILGLLQGVTEFIPVSSSGHLLLAHEVFGNNNTLGFDVALHVGTLLALLIFFRTDVVQLAKNLPQKNVHGRLARLLVIATVPAAVTGLLFSDTIDKHLRTPTSVAIALGVVAVLMLLADRLQGPKAANEVTPKQGIAVGIAQVFALIPGVSRSAITITGGMFIGLGRVQAARFSFLLAIPIIAGSAVGLLLTGSGDFFEGNWQLAVGMAASFISGILAIKLLLGVITKVGLTPFAYYRIVLAIVVLLFLV